MDCPSCNQAASSFLRNAFSLQGVSLFQSIQGYFKCQHCGTLLRIKSFRKQLWYLYFGTAIVLALFVILYRRLLSVAGIGATAALWIMILLVYMFIFIYGMWKYAQAEIVEKNPIVKAGPSV